MQATFVQEGRTIDYTPGADVTGGDVVVQNNMIGVASRDIAANALGALAVEGVVRLPKAAATAINAGVQTYWDADGDPNGGEAGSGCATTTSTGNVYAGLAVKDAASDDTTVDVKLMTAAYLDNPFSAGIADPGDAGAIPVTQSGHVSLVTAAAETRTLADPTFAGQVLALAFKTDGGDCVVTAANGVNQTGNNTLTFADAGDLITLQAIELGANLRWRAMANDGVALSTV